MSEIPLRLLVISARVPTGETCFGDNGEPCQLLDASERCGAFGWPTDGYRLDECRERDGWRCYPPDLGVAELVEAAKDWGSLDAATTDPSDYSDARNAVRLAARKLAKSKP